VHPYPAVQRIPLRPRAALPHADDGHPVPTIDAGSRFCTQETNMTVEYPGMSSTFCQWQALTELYALQLDALARYEPGAALALARTQRALEACRSEVESHGATGWH